MKNRAGFPTGACSRMAALFVAMIATTVVHGAAVSVAPGPTTITAEERAIEEDPGAGIEHAVILVEETERDEDLGEYMQTAYHLRAKILSNEGRDLANIELPLLERGEMLKEWWGRTILDGGTVLELTREDLERQTAIATQDTELRSIKAALPGVVPGCVIDYGYRIRERGYYPYRRAPIQREWPVRYFRLRWKPLDYLQSAYRMQRISHLDLRTSVEKDGLSIVGHNLPPVKKEPLMPPNHLVRASVVLYYAPLGFTLESFWNDVSRMLESVLVKPAIGKKKLVREAVTAMQLPADGALETRLRAAYDWINANIKRTDVRMFEDIERAQRDESRSRNLLRQLLESREGSSLALQILFIAVARELGAEAHLVFAADRTDTLFDPGLRSIKQVDVMLAAVRTNESADVVVVDAGSGLPYGELPWWYAGTQALMLTRSQARDIDLPTTTVRENVSEIAAKLEFVDENTVIVSSWNESTRGQVGLSERRYLRRLSPGEREERLDQRCGAGSDVDVVNAVVEGLEDLTADLRFQCETERFDIDLEGIDFYQFGWNGPWVTPTPDLPDGPRTHPVVFDFPRANTTRLTIRAPEGFGAAEPPEPRQLDSEYGRYRLEFRRTEEGFEIDRALALYPLWIPPEEYAALHEFLVEVKRSDRTVIEFHRERKP